MAIYMMLQIWVRLGAQGYDKHYHLPPSQSSHYPAESFRHKSRAITAQPKSDVMFVAHEVGYPNLWISQIPFCIRMSLQSICF